MNPPDADHATPSPAPAHGPVLASVIVPAYNAQDCIGRCLDALLTQDDPGGRIEVIVVDDGSIDDTARVVAAHAARDSRVRLLSQPNQGPAAARNQGAAEARGRFLLFTDSDCEPCGDWLAQMLQPFAVEPEISAVKGAYKTRQQGVVARFAQMEFEERYRKLAAQPEIDFVDTYAMAIRAEAFRDIGGFDTSFPTANNEDVELSYRLSSSGHKIRFNPAAIVFHHHPDTLFGYLKTKFGRAYWRMVVYRSFPEKMGGDSYTPQSLKLQILAAFALAAAMVLAPFVAGGRSALAMGGAAFLLLCLPFVAGAFRCNWLLRAGSWCRKIFKGGFFRDLRRRMAAWPATRLLAGALAGLCSTAAAAAKNALRMTRALVSSPPVTWLRRLLRRLLRGLVDAVLLFSSALVWVLGLPVRIARSVASGAWRLCRWTAALPPCRAARRRASALARSPAGMLPATVALLFLRAVVMGFGVLWGLRSKRAATGRFSEVVVLLAADAAALSAALLAAPFLVELAAGSLPGAPWPLLLGQLVLLPVFLPVALGLFAMIGLYAPCRGISQINEFAVLAKAVALLAVLAYAFNALAGRHSPPAMIPGAAVAAFILLNLGRAMGRPLVGRLPRAPADDSRSPVLIVGTGEVAALICDKISANHQGATRIVGLVAGEDDAVGSSVAGHLVIGTFEDIGPLVAENGIRDVFVALPSHPQEQVLDIVNRHSAREGVRFHIVASLCDLITAEVDIASSDTIPIMLLRNESLALLQMALKRAFDVAVSLLVLAATLPAWLVIILAIKLDTDGPAIFRQERVGKNGKHFRIFKFRTMRSDTDSYAYSPSTPGDSRITRVGAFLRRTSLDEFPQLLNVLRGEMSLVGPRPEMPFIVEQYSDWQRQRLKVKPGITGLWQIMGRKDLPLHENIEYDFYYIKNQSLLLDLSILVKTIPVILKRKGAY